MKTMARTEREKALRKRLVERWSRLLDAGDKPVKGRQLREATSIVLENQRQYFLENSTTTSPGMDTYLKITIPMIRRIFPELIANDIVGVQPMAGPVGLAFALRFQFAETRGGVNANDEAGYNLVDPQYSGVSGTGYPYETSAAELVSSAWTHYPSISEYEIPELNIKVESEQIRAGTRKLKASWTLELQQDLANVHSLDIDAEMVNMLSYEIQAEIDREMVGRMVNIAVNAGNISYWTPASSDGRWQAERFRTLYHRILIEANSIAITTRRGSGNFVICSPSVVAALQTIDNFTIDPIPSTVNSQEAGVAKVGTLDGRITVYRDTFATSDYCLVGYKGQESYDAGIIYCPYIPLLISRVQGEDDFMPRIGMMTRYGVAENLFGASLYYRIISINFGDAPAGIVYPTVTIPTKTGLPGGGAVPTFPQWV